MQVIGNIKKTYRVFGFGYVWVQVKLNFIPHILDNCNLLFVLVYDFNCFSRVFFLLFLSFFKHRTLGIFVLGLGNFLRQSTYYRGIPNRFSVSISFIRQVFFSFQSFLMEKTFHYKHVKISYL